MSSSSIANYGKSFPIDENVLFGPPRICITLNGNVYKGFATGFEAFFQIRTIPYCEALGELYGLEGKSK